MCPSEVIVEVLTLYILWIYFSGNLRDVTTCGEFNHGNIQWDTLESTGVEYQQLMCLIQNNFLTQHVLEPTRGARVLYLVLLSQKEFVDKIKIQ